MEYVDFATEIRKYGKARPCQRVRERPLAHRRGVAEALAARAVEARGLIDILINNGAVEGVRSYAAARDDEASRELFETDYWSPFVLTSGLISSMVTRGHVRVKPSLVRVMPHAHAPARADPT